MPAIRCLREWDLQTKCRRGSSRHIECPLNRQLLQQRQSKWPDATPAAGADSAGRSEKACAHIPIAGPFAEIPLTEAVNPLRPHLNHRRVNPVPVTMHCFATISATSRVRRLCLEVLASAWPFSTKY